MFVLIKNVNQTFRFSNPGSNQDMFVCLCDYVQKWNLVEFIIFAVPVVQVSFRVWENISRSSYLRSCCVFIQFLIVHLGHMCVIVSLSHQEATIQIPHISCNKHTSVEWGHNNGLSQRTIRDYMGKIFKRFHILWIPTWRWKFNEIGLTWLQVVCDKSCLRRRTTFKNSWKLGWQTELVVLRSPAADDRAIPTLRSDWSSHFLLASHWSGQSGLHLQVGKIITTETLTKLVWQLVKSQWEGDVKRTNLHRPVWT